MSRFLEALTNRENGAQFSQDLIYRYTLWRAWNPILPPFVVIGLNPSTADTWQDDPTIRRCVGFARRERCGRLVMLNLFAVRSTDPDHLPLFGDPVGQENDEVLRTVLSGVPEDGLVVAAWGNGATLLPRASAERSKVISRTVATWCFGTTQKGQPKHPLYLRSETPLRPFREKVG